VVRAADVLTESTPVVDAGGIVAEPKINTLPEFRIPVALPVDEKPWGPPITMVNLGDSARTSDLLTIELN